MKKILILTILISQIFLTSCSSSNEQNKTEKTEQPNIQRTDDIPTNSIPE